MRAWAVITNKNIFPENLLKQNIWYIFALAK